MRLESFKVGPIDNNLYIVIDEESMKGAVIDPGFELELILRRIDALGIKVEYILNTHGHVDHTAENAGLKRATRAKIAIHWADALWLEENPKRGSFLTSKPPEPSKADIMLVEGSILRIGEVEIRVLHTPGHTKGSSCFYIEREGIVFTGDTLFAGTYGRTDLPGGDQGEMRSSLLRLSSLPKDTRVLPGHGPTTSIADEAWMLEFFG